MQVNYDTLKVGDKLVAVSSSLITDCNDARLIPGNIYVVRRLLNNCGTMDVTGEYSVSGNYGGVYKGTFYHARDTGAFTMFVDTLEERFNRTLNDGY